jgi:antagonist of KipI
MDSFALQAANLLVGNPRGAAAIEIALGGFAVRARKECVVSLAGADLSATLAGAPAPRWEAFCLGEGEVLSLAGRRSGVWAYLGVAGGIDVPEVLGSRSTYTRARLGGYGGRALAPGDLVATGEGQDPLRSAGRRLSPEWVPAYGRDAQLRVVVGPDEDRFTEEALGFFFSSPYEVTARSDRVGYRLGGPALRHRDRADVLTDAVTFGTVQVPADGQPIVLAADRPTTGGYAKIATVLTADLSAFVQVPPGGTLSFRAASEPVPLPLLLEEGMVEG